MRKNIAIIIPHKGLGDLLFHINFIKSIAKKENSKIILFVNKSSRADVLYKNLDFINNIVYLDLRRPNIFLYIVKIIEFVLAINNYNISKIYYTGSNNWHLISLKILKFFYNKDYLYIKKKKDLIINELNFFLKKEKIINLNNYNFKIPHINNKKKKILDNKNLYPAVFISIDTSEEQINLIDQNLIKLIINISKKFKTIYVNSNINNEKQIPKIDNVKIITTSKLDIAKVSYLISISELFIGTESGPAVIASLLRKRSFIFTNNKVRKESKLIPYKQKRTYLNINSFNKFVKEIS